MIDASQIDRHGPRTSFFSRLFSFFLPDAPAAKAARTLDWTCARDDESSWYTDADVTLMTRSRSTWTLRPRLRPLQTGFSRPAAAASLWYSCAGTDAFEGASMTKDAVVCLACRRHERRGEFGGGDGRDFDRDTADLDRAVVLAVYLLDVVVEVRAVEQRRRDDRPAGLETPERLPRPPRSRREAVEVPWARREEPSSPVVASRKTWVIWNCVHHAKKHLRGPMMF